MDKSTFKALGLVKTLDAITKKGFVTPTPIQALTIPLLLSGKEDIVAQASTGTGKTAAFGLPLIELVEPRAGYVQAIVLTPTRELALQVCDDIIAYKGENPLTIAPVYGGQSMVDQLRKLRSGVDIVVGTPGRIMDHLRRGSLNLSKVRFVILDEADEMLDMGFVDDIETILKSANGDRRMLLFSATMSSRIMKIAEKYMKSFKVVKAAPVEGAVRLTDQIAIEVEDRYRFDALCRVIDMDPEFYGIVFCRTRSDVDNVSNKLTRRGYGADALHGDVSQVQREKILSKMRSREITVLVATDVAARGIDIAGLSHVINYALPQDPEAYIHRIGRTGRAGKNGTAITFVGRDEFHKLSFIKRVAGTEIRTKELPSVQDLILAKKGRIKEQISGLINGTCHANCREMAAEIANGSDPVDTIAALISLSFGKELDPSHYGEIVKKESRSRDHRPSGGDYRPRSQGYSGRKPSTPWKDKKGSGYSSRKPESASSKGRNFAR